jgi:WD40 repeat protein
VWALAFSRRAGLRASGTDGGSVELWPASPDDRRPLAICHQLPTRALAFSPDGKTLAVASGKQVDLLPVAQLLALGTGPEANVSRLANRKVLSHRHSVWAVAYAPDGRSVVSADTGGNLRVWSADGSASKGPDLPAHDGAIRSLAFHPAGHTLASAGEDETIRLWDTTTWQERGVLRGHRNGVLAVAFAPDGQVLASGSRDRTVKLWDLDTALPLATLSRHGGAVWAVAFSHDGGLLASAGEDKVVRIWDVERLAER